MQEQSRRVCPDTGVCGVCPWEREKREGWRLYGIFHDPLRRRRTTTICVDSPHSPRKPGPWRTLPRTLLVHSPHPPTLQNTSSSRFYSASLTFLKEKWCSSILLKNMTKQVTFKSIYMLLSFICIYILYYQCHLKSSHKNSSYYWIYLKFMIGRKVTIYIVNPPPPPQSS